MILETAGLESLCKLMQSDNSRAWGPAAQTLWQLIEDSGGPNRKGPDEDQLKIAEGIGALGGAKNAVLLLQSEDPDVIEQASSLIASLAKSQHNAVCPPSFTHRSFLPPLWLTSFENSKLVTSKGTEDCRVRKSTWA